MEIPSRIAELLAAFGELARDVLPLGVAAGAPMALAGLAAMTLAMRRPRPLAIVGGAMVGALAGLAFGGFVAVHLGVSRFVTAAVLAAAGAAGGAVRPVAFPFAVAGLPGALLGAEIPLAGRAVLGAAAGALLLGLVGLLFARGIVAAFASLVGGVLLAIGLLAAFGKAPIAHDLAAHPAALAGAALVLAVAGAAFQLEMPTSRAGPAARSRVSPP